MSIAICNLKVVDTAPGRRENAQAIKRASGYATAAVLAQVSAAGP